jgi:flagellar basal body-associated protein FliL
MEPKAIRVIKLDNEDSRVIADALLNPPVPNEEALAAVGRYKEQVKKSVETYEQRISKMTNRQLRHEVQKGIKDELTGYRAVAESVVLDVLLESFKNGMKPFVS